MAKCLSKETLSRSADRHRWVFGLAKSQNFQSFNRNLLTSPNKVSLEGRVRAEHRYRLVAAAVALEDTSEGKIKRHFKVKGSALSDLGEQSPQTQEQSPASRKGRKGTKAKGDGPSKAVEKDLGVRAGASQGVSSSASEGTNDVTTPKGLIVSVRLSSLRSPNYYCVVFARLSSHDCLLASIVEPWHCCSLLMRSIHQSCLLAAWNFPEGKRNGLSVTGEGAESARGAKSCAGTAAGRAAEVSRQPMGLDDLCSRGGQISQLGDSLRPLL